MSAQATAIPTINQDAVVDDLKQRAREVGIILNEQGLQSRQDGRLTPAIVETLTSSGLLKMFVAREAGGLDVPLPQAYATLAELVRADGPSGWCSMTGSGYVGVLLAFLSDEGFSGLTIDGELPRPAGLFEPTARVSAERVPGGYRVSGRGQFASGSRLATHFLFSGMLSEGGRPVLDANGQQEAVVCVVPRADVTVLGNWDVDGLEPTESVDYSTENTFVEDRFAISASLFGAPPLRGRALKVGVIAYGSGLHGAVALGLAQRLLEEIAVVAPKRGRGAGTVADNPVFQHELAACEIELAAARSLFMDLFAQAEDYSARTGELLPEESNRRIAAAVAHIHEVGIRCARLAYSWAGSEAFRANSAISRFYRDMSVAANHIQADRTNIAKSANDVRVSLAASLDALRPE